MVNMHVYMIRNKINNKVYIGLTTREDYRRRWTEHKKDANRVTTRSFRHPLYRSMRKHGIDNFEFKILESGITDADKLYKLETEYIIKYDSLSPKGYNLELVQEKRQLNSISLDFISRSHQGKRKKRNKNSKYMGVCRSRGSVSCEIARNREKYKKAYPSELEAAEAYDKLALYLYGEKARLNFQLENYKNINLEEFFKKHTSFEYSSKYNGVIWRPIRNTWYALFKMGDKEIKKHFKNEIEAAEFFDKCCIYYNIKTNLINFPNKKQEYLNEDLKEIVVKKIRKKASKYKNVSFYKAYNKFVGNIEYLGKKYHCGYFLKEEEAYEAVLRKKNELGIKNE